MKWKRHSFILFEGAFCFQKQKVLQLQFLFLKSQSFILGYIMSILNPSTKKYLESFIKESNPLLLEMEQFAKERNIPILNRDSAEFLEQLICLVNPKRVLELGTAIAYSSIRIARNLRKKGIVYTIEKSTDNIVLAKENITKSGFEEKINLIEGNALDELPRFEKKFDFIFLDADKIDYKRLFDYSLILLKKGGVIFVDNLLWRGYAASSKVPGDQKNAVKIIREFNAVFTSQPNLKTTILPVGDGIGVGVKI
jgi:predicted O-methyltransferase YrrM